MMQKFGFLMSEVQRASSRHKKDSVFRVSSGNGNVSELQTFSRTESCRGILYLNFSHNFREMSGNFSVSCKDEINVKVVFFMFGQSSKYRTGSQSLINEL